MFFNFIYCGISVNLKVNLGCPLQCSSFDLCVDMITTPQISIYNLEDYFGHESVNYFYSKNLLEHLGNPLAHIISVKNTLAKGGMYECITDNALFLPFYMKSLSFLNKFFKYGAFGIHSGVHFNREAGDHFAVFTDAHLKTLFEKAGFSDMAIEYGTFQFNLERFPYWCLSPRIRVKAVKK